MTEKIQDKKPRIVRDEAIYLKMEKLRAFIRWCFELLRNIAVVGVIQYLSLKTGSQLLFWTSQAATFLLVAHFYTYVEQVSVNFFPQIKRRWVAETLEFVVGFLIVGVGALAVNVGIQMAVADIAAAYQAN